MSKDVDLNTHPHFIFPPFSLAGKYLERGGLSWMMMKLIKSL